MSGRWYVITCAVCHRHGQVAYRVGGDLPPLGRALAVAAQDGRGGWRKVEDLVVCNLYTCQATGSRWEASDVAASLGGPPPLRTGVRAERDEVLRAGARARATPLERARWWTRVSARLGCRWAGR